MNPGSHGLKRELRLHDLVLVQIILILSLTWPGYAAKQGATQLALWLLAIALFYVPLAAVVMRLSRVLPFEGGAYRWVREGVSPFAGFMAGWSVTLAVIALYAAMGSSIANGLAYVAGPARAWMTTSNPLALALTAAVCLLSYFINVRGLHLARWFSGAGSALILAAFGLMLYLLARALLAGTPAARQAFSPALPGVSLLSLNVFTKMTLGGLSAFDQCSIFSEECRKPENDVARSVAIAAPLIAVLYIGGTGALLAYIPREKIDLAAALPQLLQAGFGSTGIGGLMTAACVLISVAALVAAFIISVGMLARLPMVAGWDGLLPAWWSDLDPRFRTPAKATACVAGAVMLLGLVSLWGANNEEAAQVASAVSVAGFSMVYLFLFGAVLWGFRDGSVAFGLGLKAGCLAGFLVSLLSLALSLAPLGEVASPAGFALKVTGVLVAVYGGGAVFYKVGARKAQTASAGRR